MEGYFETLGYMVVKDNYFESAAKDRWEGEIKEGETKSITFILRLKQYTQEVYRRPKYPLEVGFSYKRFGDKILGGGEFNSIIIKVIDYKEIN